MKIHLKKLKKTSGYSRKTRVINMKGGNPIQIYNDNKKNLPTHIWLMGKSPINVKKPKVKIIKSLLKNQEFVVKIEKIGEFRNPKLKTIKNEVEWSKKMSGRTNFIKFVCNFLCNDKIEKYDANFNNKPFCDGDEEISIMIIEYIDGNTIIDSNNNLLSKLNSEQLKSFIKRLYYCIIQAFFDLDFLHSDLNGVNIMIRKTNEELQRYKIKNKIYEIETSGYEPVIIDFGRSNKGFKNVNNLLDEIKLIDSSLREGLEISKNLNLKIYSNLTNAINNKITLGNFLKLLEEI